MTPTPISRDSAHRSHPALLFRTWFSLSLILVNLTWPVPRAVAAMQQDDPGIVYVAPNGNDLWSGALPAPNATKTDGPLATPGKARDVARMQRRAGLRPSVLIRGGNYACTATLTLDTSDSGSPGHDAVWSAYPGETVRFLGGKTIEGFSPVRDPAVMARLHPDARSSVLVADLRAQGITDVGTPPDRMNLFFRGARMPVARYPNEGWLRIADVPLIEAQILNPGDRKVIKNGLPAGRHSGMFRYDGEHPSDWKDQTDVWMHGYWVWDWRDAYQKVARIDTASHTVYPEPPHHHYGYQKGQRYRFLNVLEELDQTGEWYLDAAHGLVYFWPPSPPTAGDVTVSLLREPMVQMIGTSHVRIENIIFESSRASAVRIRGGSDNLIAGCTVRNIDNDTCIIIDGGTKNGVQSCDLHDIGGTGIRLVGGDRTTLTPAGNFAINNHITRYGGILQSFNGGIFLHGVGNIVAHNRIHDAPFSGIQYYGNDHRIEYNDLYDLAHESGDVGGINTGGDYTEMGTVIRHNYIHDTHGYGEGGFRGIYLDLPGSNTTIFGNILANVDIGVFFNSGRDNVVENNIFYNCHPSVNIYIWPHRSYFAPGGAWKIHEKLQDVHFTQPPYSIRYPRLPHYLDTAGLGMPYGHRVVRNVSAGGTWLDLSEGMDFTHVQIEGNLIGDSMLAVFTRKWTPDYDPYAIGYASTHTRTDTAMAGELLRHGNVIDDHPFIDPEHGNFGLRPGSRAEKAAFQQIPMDEIGLIHDRYRRTIPAR